MDHFKEALRVIDLMIAESKNSFMCLEKGDLKDGGDRLIKVIESIRGAIDDAPSFLIQNLLCCVLIALFHGPETSLEFFQAGLDVFMKRCSKPELELNLFTDEGKRMTLKDLDDLLKTGDLKGKEVGVRT